MYDLDDELVHSFIGSVVNSTKIKPLSKKAARLIVTIIVSKILLSMKVTQNK